jgi:methylmalonyl-CoA/ethylmalonyl-CoA epimerase
MQRPLYCADFVQEARAFDQSPRSHEHALRVDFAPRQPTPPTMITRIDHLGIAVRSLEASIPYYERALGLTCEHREEVPSQKVRAAFFNCGEVHLELLEPTSAESPIAKFIEKNGEGVHHVAFATTDIVGQLGQASAAGVRLIHEAPFEGAAGKLVAFLHPKSTYGVLTEFCAPKS